METFESQIARAIQPLIGRISQLEQEVTSLRKEVELLRTNSGSRFFSSSQNGFSKNRDSKSKTALGAKSPDSSTFKPGFGSGSITYRASKPVQISSTNPSTQENPKKTPISKTNSKSTANLKPSIHASKPENGSVHQSTTTPIVIKKSVTIHNTTVFSQKDSKENGNGNTKQNRSTKGDKDRNIQQQAKDTSLLVSVNKAGPSKTGTPLTDNQSTPAVRHLAVVTKCIEEVHLLDEQEFKPVKQKKVIFESVSRKNLDDNLIEKTQFDDEMGILGLVSNQSLEPVLMIRDFRQPEWKGELSIQPEVASYLQSSYLRIAGGYEDTAFTE